MTPDTPIAPVPLELLMPSTAAVFGDALGTSGKTVKSVARISPCTPNVSVAAPRAPPMPLAYVSTVITRLPGPVPNDELSVTYTVDLAELTGDPIKSVAYRSDVDAASTGRGRAKMAATAAPAAAMTRRLFDLSVSSAWCSAMSGLP